MKRIDTEKWRPNVATWERQIDIANGINAIMDHLEGVNCRPSFGPSIQEMMDDGGMSEVEATDKYNKREQDIADWDKLNG